MIEFWESGNKKYLQLSLLLSAMAMGFHWGQFQLESGTMRKWRNGKKPGRPPKTGKCKPRVGGGACPGKNSHFSHFSHFEVKWVLPLGHYFFRGVPRKRRRCTRVSVEKWENQPRLQKYAHTGRASQKKVK